MIKTIAGVQRGGKTRNKNKKTQQKWTPDIVVTGLEIKSYNNPFFPPFSLCNVGPLLCWPLGHWPIESTHSCLFPTLQKLLNIRNAGMLGVFWQYFVKLDLWNFVFFYACIVFIFSLNYSAQNTRPKARGRNPSSILPSSMPSYSVRLHGPLPCPLQRPRLEEKHRRKHLEKSGEKSGGYRSNHTGDEGPGRWRADKWRYGACWQQRLRSTGKPHSIHLLIRVAGGSTTPPQLTSPQSVSPDKTWFQHGEPDEYLTGKPTYLLLLTKTCGLGLPSSLHFIFTNSDITRQTRRRLIQDWIWATFVAF